jgi:hypothetical protein
VAIVVTLPLTVLQLDSRVFVTTYAIMLRRAVVGRVSRRWFAATAQQKRALNLEQIKGPGATTSESAKSPAPPPEGGGGGGGSTSNALPLAALGLIAAGTGYYYYTGMGQSTEETPPLETADVSKAAVVRKEVFPKETSPASSGPSGNRVLSIAVPEKMQNKADSAQIAPLLIPSHPESGNRVSSLVGNTSGTKASSDASAAIADTTTTVSAVQALQDSTMLAATEAVVQSHQSLWTAMDESYFADLDSLSASQLKSRILQLATELKDRTKWEAVRLKEFLAMKERETSDKYVD